MADEIFMQRILAKQELRKSQINPRRQVEEVEENPLLK